MLGCSAQPGPAGFRGTLGGLEKQGLSALGRQALGGVLVRGVVSRGATEPAKMAGCVCVCMHVHARVCREGEEATGMLEKGGHRDRQRKRDTERCQRLLVSLPLRFKHGRTRTRLVSDSDSAPGLHAALGPSLNTPGEIPKCHALGAGT